VQEVGVGAVFAARRTRDGTERQNGELAGLTTDWWGAGLEMESICSDSNRCCEAVLASTKCGDTRRNLAGDLVVS
jgi:hypothetical protein